MRPLLLFPLFFPLLHCTAMYGSPDTVQCSSDYDCESAFPGRPVCSADRVCVARTQPVSEEPGGCESTAICTQQNNGKPSLCRQPGTACVRIHSVECPAIEGNWQDPNAVFIGTISPHKWLQGDGNEVNNFYASRWLKAMNLALAEWQDRMPSGLPLTQRSLAIVHCNSSADEEHARDVMDHLVDTVGAKVVLAMDDTDVAAITSKAIESNTAVLCTDCLMSGPGAGLEADLVWRVLPALEAQVPMIAWRVSDLETRLRAERNLPPETPLRVAVLSIDHPAINLLVDRLRERLRFNAGKTVDQNGANFLHVQTPDPRYNPVTHPFYADEIVAFAPDIVVVGHGVDFTTFYLPLIEPKWPAGRPRPHYVTTVANQSAVDYAPVVSGNDELRARISGTTFAYDAALRANASGFDARYQARYPERADYVYSGYEAFYATAYALVAANTSRRIDGSAVARGLERLVSGSKVNVGPDAILPGSTALIVGDAKIDLAGLWTGLDWDVATREVQSDVGMYCLGTDGSGGVRIVDDAGPRWDHATDRVSGTYACQ